MPKGIVLDTAGAEITNVDMSLWKQILDTLIDPNLIVLCMSIGARDHRRALEPGADLPRPSGAISLILGLFGLQVLPISWAGLLLMLLAFGFFAAEAFVRQPRRARGGGRGLLRARRLLLFDPAGETYEVSLPAVLAIAGTLAAVMALVVFKIVQVRRAPVVTGAASCSGRSASCARGSPRRASSSCTASSGRRAPTASRSSPGRRCGSTASTTTSCSRSSRRRPAQPKKPLRAGRRRSARPQTEGSSRAHLAALIAVAAVAVLLLILLSSVAIRVAREYERGVIFRLGRLKSPPKGPGLFLLIPIIDKMVRVDLRTVTLNVPPQEVITKDNVPVRVNAVAYFRIIDPEKAIVQVENFMVATSQIAQTTLRSVLGQHVLDELLSERDKINAILQQIIDEATSPWGIKVSIVEVKDVEIPTGMQRAMARQAEAERERRAKVIAAEGEFQASERLKDAAQVHRREPDVAPAPLPADDARDQLRALVDDHPAAADRPLQAVPRQAAAGRQADVAGHPARPDLGTDRRHRAGRAKRPSEGRPARSPPDAESSSAARSARGEDRTPPETSSPLHQASAGHARLARPRRAEPLPGVRAPGGDRPRPRHVRSLAELADEELGASRGVAARLAAVQADVHALRQRGPEAGASLPHTHSQLAGSRKRRPPCGRASCRTSPRRMRVASARRRAWAIAFVAREGAAESRPSLLRG